MKIMLWARGHYDVTIELANHLARRHDVTFLLQSERMNGESGESVLEMRAPSGAGIFSYTDREAGRVLGEKVMSILDRGVKLHHVCFPSIRLKNPHNLSLVPGILRLISEARPDVIHVQGVNLHAMLAMPFIGRIKKVFTVHDYLPHSGEGAWQCVFFNRCLARTRHHLIMLGARQQKLFSRIYGVPEERISVIPMGPLTIYTKLATGVVPEEQHTVLFFGRISPYKGLEYLIEAEQHVAREIPGVRFIIAGRGDLSTCRDRMAEQGRYEIHNERVPNDVAASLFQRAACVVLPYTDATQSGVLMTAFAFGKPVVVTDVGGLPEAVQAYGTGTVVPPRDGRALAAALIAILKDGSLRTAMKKRIKKLAEGEYSWTSISERTAAVYRKPKRGFI